MSARALGVSLLALGLAVPLWATAGRWRTFETYEEFASLYRQRCPAPFGRVRQAQTREIGGTRYRLEGTRLVQRNKDQDRTTRIGVISAPKDGTTMTHDNVAAFLAAFATREVDWVLANGDLAYDTKDLTRLLEQLATANGPVFVMIGNGESVAPFNDGVAAAMAEHQNLFNLNLTRVVQGDDVALVSLPGYYDREYVHPPDGCVYGKADVDKLPELVKGLRTPVILVSHGPPRGEGAEALDLIYEKRNVGDPALAAAINQLRIPFGVFGHILEAGGRATDAVGNPIKPGTPSKSLFLNAGSASAIPWRMLDGTSSRGLAMILTVAGAEASYEVLTPGAARAIVKGGAR